MRLLLFSLLVIAPTEQAQVPVPSECSQLAKREGFPADYLTKIQAARAKMKMRNLSDNDPIVRQCREAIANLKRMMEGHQ